MLGMVVVVVLLWLLWLLWMGTWNGVQQSGLYPSQIHTYLPTMFESLTTHCGQPPVRNAAKQDVTRT